VEIQFLGHGDEGRQVFQVEMHVDAHFILIFQKKLFITPPWLVYGFQEPMKRKKNGKNSACAVDLRNNINRGACLRLAAVRGGTSGS